MKPDDINFIVTCRADCPALETNYDENFRPESYYCNEILGLEIDDVSKIHHDCPLEKGGE